MSNIMQFFLSFSHAMPIISIFLIGYIWLDRKMFFDAISLLLTAIITAHILKVIFLILVPAKMSFGYSFPSGHTIASTTFYGLLFWRNKHILIRVIIAFIIFAVCAALIYFDYHNYIDIIGGLFFGIILVLIFDLISKKDLKLQCAITFIYTTLLMIYAFYAERLNSSIFLAYYALIGLSVAELTYKSAASKKILVKILTTILLFTAVMLLRYIFASLSFYINLPPYFTSLHWLIIGYTIPAMTHFVNKIKK